MKILVTGHRGLLGGACVKAFASAEYEVVTPDNEDLRNPQEVYWLFNKHKPDGVIHCAAKVGGVKANRDNPVAFIEDNLAINSNVLSAAHAFDVKKLVNIGTSCLYPHNAPVPVREDSLLTGPFSPDVAAYATAKLVAYMQCNAYRSQHGKNFVTVCPANLYGNGDNYGPSAHVIPGLIHRAQQAKNEGKALEVWGDGTAVREFLHADDAAQAILFVFHLWDSHELINIGSGVGTTIRDLALQVGKTVGVTAIEWLPSEPTGIQHKTFDISRIESLGWSPNISLAEGLKDTYDDYTVRLAYSKLRLK